MNAETLPPELPRSASPSSTRLRGLRYSLRWLLVAMAFVAVVVSHVNTSLNLRQAEQTISHQQAELDQLRNELGVFDVNDATKAHAVFVRQPEDKAWRWRVYLPPEGHYMMKWAIDDITGEGLASQWEGQNFQPIPKESSTFNVDVFLGKAADGKWRWTLRYPWGELTRELPAEHLLLAPKEPIVTTGDPRNRPGELVVSDPRQPLVLFRCQAIPQADFDAAQAQGKEPDGPYPGIMVWIEPAK